jgi:hypothetical protein
MHVIAQFIGIYMVVTCGYNMIITQRMKKIAKRVRGKMGLHLTIKTN